MNGSPTRVLFAAWVALAWIGAPAPSVAGPPESPLLYAYDASDDHLMSFAAATPGTIVDDVPLTGLGVADELLGMDLFPLDRRLYGVVRNGTQYRVVRIDVNTGAVTSIGPDLPDAPTDTAFGVDFSPPVDRIRVGGNADSNFRMNPLTGALTGLDTDYAYVAGDPSEGFNPDIVHLAYDQNDPNTFTTTVFGIDASRDALVQIGGVNGIPFSPNSGMLSTIGLLGVDAGLEGGFDIERDTGDAYAVLRVAGASRLYAIHLPTGIATLVGTIGGAGVITAFAVPEPASGVSVLAIAIVATLARFRSARCQALRA